MFRHWLVLANRWLKVTRQFLWLDSNSNRPSHDSTLTPLEKISMTLARFWFEELVTLTRQNDSGTSLKVDVDFWKFDKTSLNFSFLYFILGRLELCVGVKLPASPQVARFRYALITFRSLFHIVVRFACMVGRYVLFECESLWVLIWRWDIWNNQWRILRDISECFEISFFLFKMSALGFMCRACVFH